MVNTRPKKWRVWLESEARRHRVSTKGEDEFPAVVGADLSPLRIDFPVNVDGCKLSFPLDHGCGEFRALVACASRVQCVTGSDSSLWLCLLAHFDGDHTRLAHGVKWDTQKKFTSAELAG